MSLDKFGELNKDCWTSMFNVKCIIKPSILKVDLLIDAISKALVFVQLKDMFLLYNHSNPWIISFNVKVLIVPTPLAKNKQIGISKYNCFLCIMSLNIILYYSFNCLSKLKYSNSSIIIKYENFVKFSSFKIDDFWFDTLRNWITKSNCKS